MKKELLRMQMLAGIINENQYKEKLNEVTYIGPDGELSGDFTYNQLQLTSEVKKYINKIRNEYITFSSRYWSERCSQNSALKRNYYLT
jgi:vacuolar-type H+-ATPase catalytic subunit A/Vma1